MATEVVAEIGMKFDKKDVVIVALAKIEAELRKRIRESKADVIDIDTKIAELENEFKENGKSNIPKLILDKQKAFDKAISDAKVSGNLKTGINHSVGVNNTSQNVYTLYIDEVDGRNGVTIFESNIKLYPRQTAILKEHSSLYDKRAQRVEDGIGAKKQLQDLPAAERQMTAVVIEHEMNQTKKGKAIIDALTKNYLNSMKLLEM